MNEMLQTDMSRRGLAASSLGPPACVLQPIPSGVISLRRTVEDRGKGPMQVYTGSGDEFDEASMRVSAEISTSATEGAHVKCQGAVRKRGQLNTAYKQRWFVLFTDGTLKYFKDQKTYEHNQPCSGTVECQGLAVYASKEIDIGTHFGFTLMDATQKQIQCSCESAQARDMWVEAIRWAASQARPAAVFYGPVAGLEIADLQRDFGTGNGDQRGAIARRMGAGQREDDVLADLSDQDASVSEQDVSVSERDMSDVSELGVSSSAPEQANEGENTTRTQVRLKPARLPANFAGFEDSQFEITSHGKTPAPLRQSEKGLRSRSGSREGGRLTAECSELKLMRYRCQIAMLASTFHGLLCRHARICRARTSMHSLLYVSTPFILFSVHSCSDVTKQMIRERKHWQREREYWQQERREWYQSLIHEIVPYESLIHEICESTSFERLYHTISHLSLYVLELHWRTLTPCCASWIGQENGKNGAGK
jgi:hypothetical protein